MVGFPNNTVIFGIHQKLLVHVIPIKFLDYLFRLIYVPFFRLDTFVSFRIFFYFGKYFLNFVIQVQE